ncbi:MAG: thiamine phosphate synthase [Bradyrhizobiaceae bacterium]|nr:thiamine phosphate synthase [Bradyrhizobiaceae bacterium]
MSRQSTDQSRTPPRLYLVTPPVSHVAFAAELTDALDAGDVAAVLVRLPRADEQGLIDHVKALAAPVQNRGAALLIGGHPEIVVPSGADGTHVTGVDPLTTAIARLKPTHIVGAGGLTSRDDAMRAGEAGADYVMFGERSPEGHRPAWPAIAERVAWWAELFVVPCVAYAEDLDEIAPFCAAHADFIAVGSAVFADPRGTRAAVSDAMARVSVAETA